MLKRTLLCLGLLSLLTAGCADVISGGKDAVAQAETKAKKIEKLSTAPKGAMPKYNSVDQIVGTQPWHTGRPTEPKPAALEKTSLIKGKVQSAGAGSITVSLDNGGSKTVQVDDDTRIFRAGDPRFFNIEGGAGSLREGQVVAIQLYEKGGQAFASTVSVGTGTFAKGVADDNENKDNQ